MEHVQTKREIAALLDAAGLRPRKRLGQHFLIDGNLMRRLVASAELESTDFVLEVGAGTGGLTDLLGRRVQRVLCVEIDQRLAAILEDRFREAPHVKVLAGDVLDGKHRLMPEVASAIRAHEQKVTGGAKLVANLPYRVATPLVMNLLLDYPEVRRLCFTVQAEVADRITASPNCKAYGPLSVLCQVLCKVQAVATVPPTAFWPRPTVESAMIRMDVGTSPFEAREELRGFASLIRATFDHRRKTLRSALGYVLDEAHRDQVCRCFDATRRPESFSIREWLGIYRASLA
jgi:16S rRNA (adenine1518-N6/adenine1519-N6)-dimethyltransferase